MTFNKKITIMSLIFTLGTLYYKSHIYAPILGHYRGEGYNFFKIIYEFSDIYSFDIPESIQTVYATQNIPFVELTVEPSIKIWGQLQEPDKKPSDNIYNVAFHPDVERWLNTHNFNVPILMGLFEPNGVEPGGKDSIPFNTFSALTVNKHDDIFYSPNNARFKIQPDRKIVTFWTIALSPDKKKTVINFNIIITDPDLQAALSQAVSSQERSNKNAPIIEALLSFSNLSEADRQALNSAIATILSLTVQ